MSLNKSVTWLCVCMFPNREVQDVDSYNRLKIAFMKRNNNILARWTNMEFNIRNKITPVQTEQQTKFHINITITGFSCTTK